MRYTTPRTISVLVLLKLSHVMSSSLHGFLQFVVDATLPHFLLPLWQFVIDATFPVFLLSLLQDVVDATLPLFLLLLMYIVVGRLLLLQYGGGGSVLLLLYVVVGSFLLLQLLPLTDSLLKLPTFC